jgi:hypothetical protein
VRSGVSNILTIVATVSAAVFFLLYLKRTWRSELRRQHNDLIGWHISVLGSTYAVIVGFMLFAVWSNFQVAEANAESEANCLVNVVRASRGLPSNQHETIHRLAKEYVTNMLTLEWPAMDNGKVSPESQKIIEGLWEAVTGSEIHTPTEQVSLDRTLNELARMTEFRRLREIQVGSDLPDILWLVLIVGATVTIASACLFGTADIRLHIIQVGMLALMISSILVAIGDINHPYQGAVRVGTAGFQRAKMSIERIG